MKGITRDSLVEMFDRKLVYVFAVVTALTVLIVILSGSIDGQIRMQTGGDMNVDDFNQVLGDPIIRVFEFFVSFLVFLAVMGTAGMIPTMLEKGRADYYLSKPISRTALFLNKFVGILIVYGLTIILCGGIVYLSLGLVHGIFDFRIVYLFLFSLLAFFIWYSITAFAGIVFGSNAIAIMSAFIVWILQKILSARDVIKTLADSKPVDYIVDTSYYIIPKTGEISDMSVRMVSGRVIHDWMPLYSSLLFAIVLVYVTIYIFKRKNY
ncbi:MAG: hypothetical protein JXA92_03790 [candidate division Zixibacteria bacterium]|nr:hypothetical protein [candidate division Zixibacteria bacterium]